MQSQNGTTRIQTRQFDPISEIAHQLRADLAGVNHKLDRLDVIEERKGTLSRGQEHEYDALVDSQIELVTDLHALAL